MIRTRKPKKKKISPQSAKAKGRRLQQWTCQKISDITRFQWGSSGDDCPIESRPMGQPGCDVRMEREVRKLFPFSVECKWQETWAVPTWIRQARANRMKGTNWLLICKRSREKEIVIMDAKAFFELQDKAMRYDHPSMDIET